MVLLKNIELFAASLQMICVICEVLVQIKISSLIKERTVKVQQCLGFLKLQLLLD